jgi:hypothetical protein
MSFTTNAKMRVETFTMPDGDPENWSDADKLRALALICDSIQMGNSEIAWAGQRDNSGDSIQRDLWRIADRLQAADAVEGET